MKHPYRLVVFDWEGTLGDTLGKALHALVNEAQVLGFGNVDINIARRHIALGLIVALKKLFPEVDEDRLSVLIQRIQNAMIGSINKVYVMPDVDPLLATLKSQGVILAVATNKGQSSLIRELEGSGLNDYFSITRTASQAPPKPCPQMLEEIMDWSGVSPAETLMIGDSVSDIEMAKFSNVDAIGMDFYHQNAVLLEEAGAKKVFDNFQQLSNYLGL